MAFIFNKEEAKSALCQTLAILKIVSETEYAHISNLKF